MTDEELQALEAEVCDLLGIEPRIVWILTHDGGKSAYFNSDYRSECEEHLADMKRRFPKGWAAQGEVSSWKHYPPIAHDTSEGWSAMRLVVEGMEAKGYSCQIHFHVVDDEGVWAEFVKNRLENEVGQGEEGNIPLAVTAAAKDALSKEAQKA